ncbi:hypothetical protein GJV85_03425 [Sulfurimonas aquatica]|uniref:Uncharacterized protein n=1 Tax=Sulfurimonas aquatica TaxID=2672570 RepID=A0A975AZ21_9BACT|nr:hypothetical protein [Sulfurimonas aquatica]QSZ41202.1 hypothetical protein GJV85_03425 [Sulfurimonas aquatica]
MENPFESGHIKNYLLFYASIVVIVILFFMAATLFHDVEVFDKKIFDTEVKVDTHKKTEVVKREESKLKFKLLEKAY